MHVEIARDLSDLFLEDSREIPRVDALSLNLCDLLQNVADRAARDSEVLSCVCDDQASQ